MDNNEQDALNAGLEASSTLVAKGVPPEDVAALKTALALASKEINKLATNCLRNFDNWQTAVGELSELERKVSEARMRILKAQLGSCTCLTKTPEYRHHSEDCAYRHLGHILSALDGD